MRTIFYMADFNFFSRVSLTTDGWSSVAGDPYLSLTAHYIDENWKLQMKCLKTEYHPESHTAINVANFIRGAIDDYGLRLGNIVSITTDNAANMVAAIRRAV